MKKLILMLFGLFISCCCLSEHFFYPVANFSDSLILVLYQKSLDDLELWSWDKRLNILIRQLSDNYFPSQVQVLPDGKAFSFVDRDRVRVKYFLDDCVKSINIVEPVSSLMSVTWIDNSQFYFSGKSYRSNDIFLCETSCDFNNSQMKLLTNRDGGDYVFPNKVKDRLFCVAKSKLQDDFIISLPWCPRSCGRNDFEFVESKLVFRSKDPICFLKMKNNKSGFFLQYSIYVNKFGEKEGIVFNCCSVCLVDDRWYSSTLFSFGLPLYYVVGNSELRVFESIAPFLPDFSCDDFVYYVNYDKNCGPEGLIRYNLESNKIEQICCKSSGSINDLISPKVIGNDLYSGLIIPNSRTFDEKVDLMNFNLLRYVRLRDFNI